MNCPYCNNELTIKYFEGFICKDKHHCFVIERFKSSQEHTLYLYSKNQKFCLMKTSSNSCIFSTLDSSNNYIKVPDFNVSDMGRIIKKYAKLLVFT